MASSCASESVAKSKHLGNRKSGGFLCCAYKTWWGQNGSPRLLTHGDPFLRPTFSRTHEPVKRCLKSAMFTLKMKILILFKQIQQTSQLIKQLSWFVGKILTFYKIWLWHKKKKTNGDFWREGHTFLRENIHNSVDRITLGARGLSCAVSSFGHAGLNTARVRTGFWIQNSRLFPDFF